MANEHFHKPQYRCFSACIAIAFIRWANVQDLFHKGEKVRSIIANIDPDTQRIGLSTAEIEPESGDMLFNKVLLPVLYICMLYKTPVAATQ